MKINLKPQKDVGKTELKLPRSGFVHLYYIPISEGESEPMDSPFLFPQSRIC